jgi:hypothetical protein
MFGFPTTTTVRMIVAAPCFGGGNLIGKSFTLTLTMSVPSGMTSGQIRAATTRPTAAQIR